MRNVVLRPGSSGPFVRDLQLALNNRLNPSPNLIVNGLISPQTQAALRSFQRANWLEEDGIAGPCTLDALYDTETTRPVLHSLGYVSQPSLETAWAAAIAMLKGVSLETVQFLASQTLPDTTGELTTQRDNRALVDRNLALAQALGLKYHPQRVWPVAVVVGLVQRAAIVLVFKAGSDKLGKGRTNSRYIVVAGARGSHAPDGTSTTFRVYDPAFGRDGGGIYSSTYTTLVQRRLDAAFGMLAL